MSFNQLSFEAKTGVNADFFSAQSSLQYMARHRIVSLSVEVASFVGLVSSGLFCTAPVTLLPSTLEQPYSSVWQNCA